VDRSRDPDRNLAADGLNRRRSPVTRDGKRHVRVLHGVYRSSGAPSVARGAWRVSSRLVFGEGGGWSYQPNASNRSLVKAAKHRSAPAGWVSIRRPYPGERCGRGLRDNLHRCQVGTANAREEPTEVRLSGLTVAAYRAFAHTTRMSRLNPSDTHSPGLPMFPPATRSCRSHHEQTAIDAANAGKCQRRTRVCSK
jgi:hypothetical protein